MSRQWSRRACLQRSLGAGVLAASGVWAATGWGTGWVAECRAATGGTPDPALSGRWMLLDGSRARAQVLAGIDAAVEDMSVVIRGFARRRLRETVSPPDWIELAVEDTAVVMSGPDRRRLKIETDRKPRGIKGGGEDIEVSAWWEGHVLVRRFQGRGRREDRLSCAGEGDDIRLTMRTTISASRMPTPVRFRLRFRPDEGR